MTESSQPIRVLLIDDHLVMREALSLLLTNRLNLQIVGETADGEEAIALARLEHPDIILLEPFGSNSSGLHSIPRLLAAAPYARLIVLTGTRDRQLQSFAISMDAMGLVLKEEPSEVLLKAIECVRGGEVWIERSMMAEVLNGRSHKEENTGPDIASFTLLSPREREVIRLIGEGLKNKQIAERLFISERTVHNHLASTYRKLNVSSRQGLAILAMRYEMFESSL